MMIQRAKILSLKSSWIVVPKPSRATTCRHAQQPAGTRNNLSARATTCRHAHQPAGPKRHNRTHQLTRAANAKIKSRRILKIEFLLLLNNKHRKNVLQVLNEFKKNSLQYCLITMSIQSLPLTFTPSLYQKLRQKKSNVQL